MEIVDYLLARKKAGGGSDVTIEQLSVTENGTYSEQGIAYSPVVVNVPAPANSYQLKNLPSGTVSTIEDGTDLPMSSLKVGIEPVQEGSGDPSPDNIRPISGWTAANVTRTGKNLTDDFTDGSYIDTDGTEKYLTSYRCTDYVNVNGITTLKVTVSTTYPNFWVWRIASYDINKNFIELSLNRVISKGDFEEDVTLPSNAKYIRASAIINSTNWNIYDKTTSSTYTIQFKDGTNPLTVYGGTLDVTTGELVVDRKLLLINGDSNVSAGAYKMPFKISIPNDAKAFASAALWGSKCNMMTEVVQESSWGVPATYSFAGNLKQIFFKLTDDLTDVDELKAFLTENPIKICYFIDTPTTYHLTPTQVRTLAGTNNIWADTGDVLSGKYFKEL